MPPEGAHLLRLVAKDVTLSVVSWIHLLNEAAPAAENPIISIKL
jgi:hypothetical protein